MPRSQKKVFLLGIDGLVPRFVFETYKKNLPAFSKLMDQGIYGRLRSTVPPSSIVAWTSLNSGYDPSETGIHSYTSKQKPGKEVKLASSNNVRVPLLWDVLTAHKKKTIALNIPLTYPAKKINGVMVTDFLTPRFDERSVYPPSLKKTITALLHGKDYMFDVAGFTGYKKLDLDRLIKKTYVMTKQHFKVARYLFTHEDWDFFNMVVIGTDRLHHMFWKHIDPSHPHFIKNSPYKNVVRDFYAYVDSELKWFLKSSKIDAATSVIVASDHGMDVMKHRINLNDWLRENGYLVLKPAVKAIIKEGPQKLNPSFIDWKKTMALANGSYQGRIYIYKKSQRKAIVNNLTREFLRLKGVHGEKLNTKVFDTSHVYRRYDPEAPDMIVYFDNLRYGVNNEIGNKGLYSAGTSVGIDDAGHAPEGTLIIRSPLLRKQGLLKNADILQITPTILKIFGLPHAHLQGKSLV